MPTPIRASFPEQNSSTDVGLTTIHKFENGTTGNLSLSTFLLLLKVVGQINSLDDLLPELPESFYLMRSNEKKSTAYKTCQNTDLALIYYYNPPNLNIFRRFGGLCEDFILFLISVRMGNLLLPIRFMR